MACRCGWASRPSGKWNEDDYDIADGTVVGSILKVHTAPVGMPWMWIAFGHLRGCRLRIAVAIGCAGNRFNLSPGMPDLPGCREFQGPADGECWNRVRLPPRGPAPQQTEFSLRVKRAAEYPAIHMFPSKETFHDPRLQ
jgi:hypothetical protein